MKDNQLKLGPLSLLLTAITICLIVLSVLSFTTARADESLSMRHAETVRIRFLLENEGEMYLKTVDEYILDGKSLDSIVESSENGLYTKNIEKDGYILHISFREKNGGISKEEWTIEKIFEKTDKPSNIWQGNK